MQMSIKHISDVHLSRQHYKSCLRKNSGKSYICYWPCTSVVGKSTSITAGSPVIIQVRAFPFHEMKMHLRVNIAHLSRLKIDKINFVIGSRC